MQLDYDTLEQLRSHHAAWRLLRSDHVALVVSFLNRVFIETNQREIAETDLIEKLEDQLFALREGAEPDRFSRQAKAYLEDWASAEKGWLRKYYVKGLDEAVYDLTPATEKAVTWLKSLVQREFVGTASRLKSLFDLLQQLVEASETDVEQKLAQLAKRKAEIDQQMLQLQAGIAPPVEGVWLREQFLQFSEMARALLADFREVEANFRQLDRQVRVQMTTWSGSKGALLDEILGDRDAITDSDQGRSFRAFWDFLMSSERQEQLQQNLQHIFALPEIQQLNPDPKLKTIHHDWLAAGEHTQRVVSTLSRQLRRFLDDQAWLENRRIMALLKQLETRALQLQSNLPKDVDFMTLPDTKPTLNLPMARPLYVPKPKHQLSQAAQKVQEAEVVHLDLSDLLQTPVVDKKQLWQRVAQQLRHQSQVTLAQVCEQHPIEQGLAEVVTYLQMAAENDKAVIDDDKQELLYWQMDNKQYQVKVPQVIFLKSVQS